MLYIYVLVRGGGVQGADTGRVFAQLRGGIKLSIIAPSGARVPAARVAAESEQGFPQKRSRKKKENMVARQEEQGEGPVVEVAELDCRAEGVTESGVYLVQVFLFFFMRDTYVRQA